MSVLKKIPAFLFYPIINPITSAISSLTKSAYEAREAAIAIKNQSNASLPDPHSLSEKEFLFALWGISDNEIEIKKVKKGLLIEFFGYSLVVFIPILGVISDPGSIIYIFSAVITIPLFLFAASKKAWQMDCIQNERLTSYLEWISSEKTYAFLLKLIDKNKK